MKLKADVFDTLKAAVDAQGGVGVGTYYQEDETPCCIAGFVSELAKGGDLEAETASYVATMRLLDSVASRHPKASVARRYTESISDMIVTEYLDEHGGERMPFDPWAQAFGLERDA